MRLTRNKPIRVLFVFSDRSGSCTMKRTFEVVQALHQYQRHAIFAQATYFENLTEQEFEDYEIILFQRLGGNRGIVSSEYREKLLQWMQKYREKTIYVYDIDDYIFESQNSTPVAMMNHCHVALAPNHFIAKLMSIHQPRYHVIRTHIDLKTVEKAPKAQLDPKFTHIGWFSIAAQGIDIIEAIYPELVEKWLGKVQIHAYIDQSFIPMFEKRFSKGLIIAYPRVSLAQMYVLEKGMDILINPLNCHEGFAWENDKKFKFLNSKSEIKYLHAGAAKKPLIVTPIHAYQYAIQHGVTGFLADSAEDWLKYIKMLVDHPKLRKQIGKQAYQDVCKKYTYKQVAQQYARFFKKIKSEFRLNEYPSICNL